MNLKKMHLMALATICICLEPVSSQELADLTLNYTDVTSTNVNQTVNELLTMKRKLSLATTTTMVTSMF